MKMRHIVLPLVAFIGAAVRAHSAPVEKETPQAVSVVSKEDVEQLPMVSYDDIFRLVEAVSKRPQTQAEVPGIVTVMTGQEMQELGLKTIEDALTLIPGFEVNFGGRRSTVYTRGLVESALVLIDQVPIVSPHDNEVFLDEAIPLDTIERIEVVRGPGGVLWGPYALNGIINIVTKNPVHKNGLFTARGEFGSYFTRKLGMGFDRKLKNFGVVANFSELRTNDYKLESPELRSPFTGRWNDGYIADERKEDFFREIFLKLNAYDFTLTTRFADEQDFFQIHNRGTSLARNFDLEERDPIKEFIKLQYDKKFEPLSVMARLWTVNRESYLTGSYNIPDHPSGNIQWVFDTWKSQRRGAEVEVVTDKLIPRNTLLAGASYIESKGTDIYTWDYIKDIGDTGPNNDIINPRWFYGDPPAYDSGNGFIIRHLKQVDAGSGESVRSIYLHDTWNVIGRLNVAGGWRYDANSIYAATNHYSGSAVYEFIRGHYLKYMYAQGFRPADWEQKTSITNGGGDLQPEQSQSHDVQYNGRIGPVSYFANWAHTEVTDLVTFREIAPDVLRYRNLGKIQIDTAETGVRYNLPRALGYVFTNYSYKTLQDSTTGDVPYVANHIANLGSHFKLPFHFAGSVVAHYEGEKKQMFFPPGLKEITNDASKKILRKLDPYTVVNAGLHFKYKAFTTSFFCYNLLDTEYQTTIFPGQNVVPSPNPRRHYMLRASFQF